MNQTNTKFDASEQDLFFAEVPDTVLERAACVASEAGVFTIAMCTGNAECPF